MKVGFAYWEDSETNLSVGSEKGRQEIIFVSSLSASKAINESLEART